MTTRQIKQGDTFYAGCSPTFAGVTSYAGWSIQSKLKTQKGGLVATLTVSPIGSVTGQANLTCADTTGWPVGLLNWDILYIDPQGNKRHTTTVQVNVLASVT